MAEKKILKFKGEIKLLDVSNIIPYEFNNKIHEERQINLLSNIIGKFGYVDEIVVDKNNIVIAGHGRLESVKKMGYDAVEVKVLDIDSKKASEIRLLHNKISEYGNESNFTNIKLELDMLGYEDEIEGIDGVTFKDLFPEFDAPDFDESEGYETPSNNTDSKISVISVFTDMVTAELCKKDLEGLGYQAVIKG